MQKTRGIYTSEFWVAAVGSAAVALVALESGYRSEGAEPFGIALIVSTYIGGRCLIKAADQGGGGVGWTAIAFGVGTAPTAESAH